MSKKLVIGTRGSILAIAQAEFVKEILLQKNNNLEIEIKIIVTKGDKDLRDFKLIKDRNQKDLFVKEIENEMLMNKIDIAVHSLKDMPSITPKGLVNQCFPIREDNRDVLISNNGIKLKDMPKNSKIGTGSIRRKYEVLSINSDVIIEPIRGNIHTRLKKLEKGEYDGIILAAAGLKRVGLSHKITEYFEINNIMPAPGQGILCIQCRENDKEIIGILETIQDKEVKLMTEAEREFSYVFEGSCHTPMGCSSKIVDENIEIKGMFNDNGNKIISEIKGKKEDAKLLGRELAEKIKEKIKNNI